MKRVMFGFTKHSAKSAEAAFDLMDTNKDGLLSFGEFMDAATAALGTPPHRGRLEQLFKKWDTKCACHSSSNSHAVHPRHHVPDTSSRACLM